jgi:hypothetical protein
VANKQQQQQQQQQLVCIGFFMLFCLIATLSFSSCALGIFPKNDSDASAKNLEQLKNFALAKINADRENFGLAPVSQSNNTAAQVQADELMQTQFVSHMTVDGLKPYMLYSLYNGTGYVQQNLGQISYMDSKKSSSQNNNTADNTVANDIGLTSSELCSNTKMFHCLPIDPYRAIENLEYLMIYDDAKCCNNGHRNNTLNNFHTHVSLGIAFSKYYFVMVQNFENRYLEPNYLVQKDKENIKLKAKIIEPNKVDFQINHVSFFLDDLPNRTEYEKNKNKTHYELGDLKLIVSKPLPSYVKYQQNDNSHYKIIEAKKWDLGKYDVNLEIKIPDYMNLKDKVMTMVVYAKKTDSNDGENENTDADAELPIPLTSHTFFNY